MSVYELDKNNGETLEDIELDEDEIIISSRYVGGGTEVIETEVRPFGCEQCEERFASEEALSGHMNAHSDEGEDEDE